MEPKSETRVMARPLVMGERVSYATGHLRIGASRDQIVDITQLHKQKIFS